MVQYEQLSNGCFILQDQGLLEQNNNITIQKDFNKIVHKLKVWSKGDTMRKHPVRS
jgi:hypothetical protein